MLSRRELRAPAAVFLLYLAAGRLGLLAPFTSGNVSPVWPASGAALAAVLLFDYRVWPAVLAAAFLVNFWSPIPARAALGLAAGNTASAVAGAALLRRLARLDPRLPRLRDVLAFQLLGALASPLIAATVGTVTLYAFHVAPWSRFSTAWRVWWLGDAMGVLLAAPPLLTAKELPPLVKDGRRLAELAALTALTALTGLATFGPFLGGPGRFGIPSLACFPLVAWGALRFRLPGASIASFLLAGFAVWGTAAGYGPFTRFEPAMNALLLQFFLAVMSATGMVLASVVSERERAVEALRELSLRLLHLQDSERRRIARELHDGTGQSLTALKLSLASARRLAGPENAQVEELLGHSLRATDQVAREIRTLSYLLHPPLLEDAGLASALRWYVDGLAERASLVIELDMPAELPRLPHDLELAAFRIVQEALTNVVRHSGSPTATVRLAVEAGVVRVAVSDRGKGLPAQAPGSPRGVGIQGMRERARELGGRLSLRDNAPGAVVEAELPLPASDR